MKPAKHLIALCLLPILLAGCAALNMSAPRTEWMLVESVQHTTNADDATRPSFFEAPVPTDTQHTPAALSTKPRLIAICRVTGSPTWIIDDGRTGIRIYERPANFPEGRHTISRLRSAQLDNYTGLNRQPVVWTEYNDRPACYINIPLIRQQTPALHGIILDDGTTGITLTIPKTDWGGSEPDPIHGGALDLRPIGQASTFNALRKLIPTAR